MASDCVLSIFDRIEEVDSIRTPDYKLYINNYLIIVEIKDLEMNKEERLALKSLKSQQFAVWGNSKVGNRIRNKIKDNQPVHYLSVI